MNNLFSEGKIGNLSLRNRTIRAAAFESMCEHNSPSQMLFDYHTSVARGGIGMTTVAYASVTRNGLSFDNQLLLREEVVPDLKRLTDAIHSEGAAASIQIGHCGNMSKRSVAGETPVSASSGFNIYSPTLVRGLRESEIYDLVKAFGRSVDLVKRAGFDAVEVHAGHGYLISQFLSPYTNHRKDKFGGSLENRMLFMRLVIEEVVRVAAGEISVIVKTNMRDGFNGGNELEEGLIIAKELERLGVDALVLSGGFVSRAPMYVMRGYMPLNTMTYYMKSIFLKIGVKMFGRFMIPGMPYKDCYFLEDALKFREQLTLPLIYVGGVTSRHNAEKILDLGFEFVSMARVLVRETDFVNRMQREQNAVSECNHKNYCIARMYSLEMKCHTCVDNLPGSIRREVCDE